LIKIAKRHLKTQKRQDERAQERDDRELGGAGLIQVVKKKNMKLQERLTFIFTFVEPVKTETIWSPS